MSERGPLAVALQIVAAGVGLGMLYATWKTLRRLQDEDGSVGRGLVSASRLRARGVDVALTTHEQILCSDLVFAEDLTVGFDDVAGLDEVKQGLRDVVALLKDSRKAGGGSSRSALRTVPRGILLYGPPGNGKTMMAAALAKELDNCCFLTVQAANIFQKYVGESEKMARAIFSLARKLAPCVVFLDEVDMVLQRDGGLNASNNKVLGLLLADWDGLSSGADGVLVVATTNRPKDLDTALHRRLPRQYYLGLPDEAQRERILLKILAAEQTEEGLVARVAAATDRYCGSDLMELCKAAMACRMREDGVDRFVWRHFEEAMKCVKFAGSSAENYGEDDMRKWFTDILLKQGAPGGSGQ